MAGLAVSSFLMAGLKRFQRKENAMKLKEITKEISLRQNLSQEKVRSIINCFLDIVVEELSQDREIYLRRLGRLFTKVQPWHFHDKHNRLNPFDNVHRRGVSNTPHIKFSHFLKRKCKEKRADRV